MPINSLTNLRPDYGGIASSFEEFCCQLFHRASEAPSGGRFKRIRGAGGDGGVEAVWEGPGGSVWGLQAKYFQTLGASQKSQMKESLDQALANYQLLAQYTFCLPITLTGKKGAKAGKQKFGQHQRLSDWIEEWRLELADAGRKIKIDVWAESELLGRLIDADTNGGMRLYWFNEKVFSDTWFADHLNEAKAQAGKRYTPELSVDTPLGAGLQAFGRSEIWVKRVGVLVENFSDKVDQWRQVIKTKSGDISGSLASELTDAARQLLSTAEKIEPILGSVVEQPEVLETTEFRDAVLLAIEQALSLEPKIKETLEKEHGQNADSAGFRQWSAEYMVSFPMAPLDDLRALITVLQETKNLAVDIEGRLPASSAMLIRGPAGIGKTHGILDAASERRQSGMHSIILFGEDFNDGDPWMRIASKLGLGAACGREDLLDALEAAGEATGFSLVVFIDALNETTPDRRRWQAWLPPMVEQVGRRRFLKLCVSCRDTYLQEVLPDQLPLPQIEHNGFAGNEYAAISQFFQHYGLGPPTEPLLQEEFANPLFLHLVCTALQETDRNAIPPGREGFSSIVTLLLSAKNENIARECDYDSRENRLHQAVLALASNMAISGTRQIPLAEAKAVVESLHPTPTHSKSIFNALERESLIAVVGPPATGFRSSPTYNVRFTFERIGDYFIAEHLLSVAGTDVAAAFDSSGCMHFMIADDAAVAEHAGLLEAVAIQIAETHGRELIDVARTVDPHVLALPVLAGLQWRDSNSITFRTSEIVRQYLGSNLIDETIEALLKLSPRPNHPLNAQFLDRLLTHLPMLRRDPLWAYQLERSFSGWAEQPMKGAAFRLIEWALKGKLDGLDDHVAELWATALAWFCASPNRRIRDQATKGMVKIFLARPTAIVPLTTKFLCFEDEYVSERVLVAAYGALLLRPSPEHLHKTASEVYSRYFMPPSKPPLNASLRDHGRLIIELAIDMNVAQAGISEDFFRPPYESPWPISLPSEQDVAEYVENQERYPRMNLVEKVGLATGSDFARYIVHPAVTSAFDIEKAGLDELSLFRWFLSEAVSFGYPGPSDSCAGYDSFLLGKYGGGRGKPKWAERLGKKYYWIFLRRLVGQIADHIPRKDWSAQMPGQSSDLQALNLRDLDPTDLRMSEDRPVDNTADWFIGNPYVFTGLDDSSGDNAWVAAKDMPEFGAALVVADESKTDWHVLSMWVDWNGVRRQKKIKTYRHVNRGIHSLTCHISELKKIREYFSGKKWSIDIGHFEPHDYRGYLAEYPHRWAYRQRFELGFNFEQEVAEIPLEAVALRQLKGAEWEYDYSTKGGSPSLLMPAPALIEYGGLQWDGRGSWVDKQSTVKVIDPNWWQDTSPALITRLDFFDSYLTDTSRALVVCGFQSKYIAGVNTDGPGMIEEAFVYVRIKGQTEMIGRKTERWKSER